MSDQGVSRLVNGIKYDSVAKRETFEMTGRASDVTRRLGLGSVNIVFDGNLIGIRDESKFLVAVEAVGGSRGTKFFAEFDWDSPAGRDFFPSEVAGLCGCGFSAAMALQDLFEKLVQIREHLHRNEKKSQPGDPAPKSLRWINEVFEFTDTDPLGTEVETAPDPAVNSKGGCFFEGLEFDHLSGGVQYSWWGDISKLTSKMGSNQVSSLTVGLPVRNQDLFRISLVANKIQAEPALYYARICATSGRGIPTCVEKCCGWGVDAYGAIRWLFHQVQMLSIHLQERERSGDISRIDSASLSWLREAFEIHPLPESSEPKVETIFNGINYQEAERVNIRYFDGSLSTIAGILGRDTDRLLARGITKIADESAFDIGLICIEGGMFEWPLYISKFDSVLRHPKGLLPNWVQQICGCGFSAEEAVQSLLVSHGNYFVGCSNASDDGVLSVPGDIESFAWYKAAFGEDQPWNEPADVEYESEWEDPASRQSFQAEIRAADEELFSQWVETFDGFGEEMEALSHIQQIHDGNMVIAELSLEDIERMGSLWNGFRAVRDAAQALTSGDDSPARPLVLTWTESRKGDNGDWKFDCGIRYSRPHEDLEINLSPEDVKAIVIRWNGFQEKLNAGKVLPVVDADEFPDHYRKSIDSEIVNADRIQLNRWLWTTAGSCDKYIPYKAIADLHNENNDIRNFVDSDMKRIFDAWQNFKRFRDGEAIYSAPPTLPENKTKNLEREIFQADQKQVDCWIESDDWRGVHSQSAVWRIQLVNKGEEHLYSSDSDDFIKQIESAWSSFLDFKPQPDNPTSKETFDLSFAIASADPNRLKTWALMESGKVKSLFSVVALSHLQKINQRQMTLTVSDSPETIRDVKSAWEGFVFHEKVHDELNSKIQENKKPISQLDPGQESLPPAIGEGEQISGNAIQEVGLPAGSFGPDVDLRESAFDDVTPYSVVKSVPQVESVIEGLRRIVEQNRNLPEADKFLKTAGVLEAYPDYWPKQNREIGSELVYSESLYDAMNRIGDGLKIQIDRDAKAQVEVIRYPHATGFIASITCDACADCLFSVYGSNPGEAIQHLLAVLWAAKKSQNFLPVTETDMPGIFDRIDSIREFTNPKDSIPLPLISEQGNNTSLQYKAPEKPASSSISKVTSLDKSDCESPSVLSDDVIGKDFGYYAGVDSKSPTGWGLLTRSKVVEIKSICSELYFFEPGFLVELIESEPGAKLPWAARPFLFPQVGFSSSMEPRRCIENMMRNLVSEMESLILFSDFRNEYGNGKADRPGFYPETRDEQVRFLTEKYFRSYKTRLGYSSSLDFEYRVDIPEGSRLFREAVMLKWLEVDYVCEIDEIRILGYQFQYRHLVLIWVDRGDSETPPVFKAALRAAPHIWMGRGKTKEDAVASLLSKIHDSYERYLASGDLGRHSDSQYIYGYFQTHSKSKKNDRIHFQMKMILETETAGWEDWILENGFVPMDSKAPSRDVLILDQQDGEVHSSPVEVSDEPAGENPGLSATVFNDTANIEKLDAIEKKVLGISKCLLDTKCLISSIEICAVATLREKLAASRREKFFGIPFKIVFSIAFMWLFFMVARLYLEYFIGFWE